MRVVALGGRLENDGGRSHRYGLSCVDVGRPRVCLVPTASGDDEVYIAETVATWEAYGCSVSVLRLFNREVADLAEFIGLHDLVYAMGGNTANLLAVWQAHDLDGVLRAAASNGVVMAGSSAGASCWFDSCATDSLTPGRFAPLRGGVGLVQGSFCPHAGEPGRLAAYERLVMLGNLPRGHAAEDGVALRFDDGLLTEAFSTSPDAVAWRVGSLIGGASREPIPTGE